MSSTACSRFLCGCGGNGRIPRGLLVVCKTGCFSLRAFDLAEDLVGVLGPGERDGVLAPVVDERADR